MSDPDQDWIDAASADEDQLLPTIRAVLQRALEYASRGEVDPRALAELSQALNCVSELQAIKGAHTTDEMRAHYDFTHATQGPAVPPESVERPPIREIAWDGPKMPDGPLRIGDHFPGLYLSGKSCALYYGGLLRATEYLALDRMPEFHRKFVPGILKSLAKDLDSAILRRREP